jgi:hypothetical protein
MQFERVFVELKHLSLPTLNDVWQTQALQKLDQVAPCTLPFAFQAIHSRYLR